MEFPVCPRCKSNNTYLFEDYFICPDCFNEWSPAVEDDNAQPTGPVVKDAYGNLLQDGDTVVTIKNLPVKGTSQSIKAGTKVKNIRLTEGDHNIDCRVEGFGSMALKSEFVKKA